MSEQGDLFRGLGNPFDRGTPERTRYEEMREQAIEFHREHPVVWQYFCRFARDRIQRGFKHYSVNGIFERIRWETAEARDGDETKFKLNNNHRPFYARAFMAKHPEHEGFFRTRLQTSRVEPAVERPPLTPFDFDGPRV